MLAQLATSRTGSKPWGNGREAVMPGVWSCQFGQTLKDSVFWESWSQARLAKSVVASCSLCEVQLWFLYMSIGESKRKKKNNYSASLDSTGVGEPLSPRLPVFAFCSLPSFDVMVLDQQCGGKKWSLSVGPIKTSVTLSVLHRDYELTD